jgi:hypothetical protein
MEFDEYPRTTHPQTVGNTRQFHCQTILQVITGSTKGTRMHFSFKQTTALLMAVLFVLPANVIAGPATQAHARPKLRNVELAQGGEVQGRVLDIHGRPVADTTVQVMTKAGKRAAKTNKNGQFKLAGFKGGVCAIQVGEARYGARLWTQGTAPPQSLQQFSVVNDPNYVVRGQDSDGLIGGMTSAQWLGLTLIIGGIVAIAVAADDDAS